MSERIKIKYWWSEDRKWFCVLVDDGNAKATVSLTPEEAGVLSMHAVLPVEKVTRRPFAPEDLALLREKGFVETADEIERLVAFEKAALGRH